MGMANKLVVFIHFLSLLGSLTECFAIGDSPPKVVCIEAEREALLRFKRDLVDPENFLSNWLTESDCCEWNGIWCDDGTGHVTMLNLKFALVSGKISPYLRNLTHLTLLDLSYNNFDEIEIPSFLGSLVSLTDLRLYEGGFGGMLPPQLGNLSNLQNLNIYGNDLYANNLNWVSNLSSIESLGINNVKLIEPSEIPSLNKLLNLTYLDLGYNGLKGVIPSNIANLTSILSLRLSHNSLQGNIPMSIGNLGNLETLDLSYNSLQGNIPMSIGNLCNLKYLELSHNKLTGVVSEAHFVNLTNLNSLGASGNLLTLRVSPEWIPPFQLSSLNLGSWNLGPLFPMWLKSQNQISEINLSSTGISGTVPNWIFYNSELKLLDLSNNSLSADIFGLLCNPISKPSLRVLKVRDNILAGEIPDCWVNWPSLAVIDLGNNNLSGGIPSSMGLLQNLIVLELRNNSLTGEIPNSLHNCSILELLDLSRNKLAGSVPMWIESLPFLSVLILRSNALKGQIPVELCSLVHLQILDVADNNLSGTIPHCFENFTAMTVDNSRENTYYMSEGKTVLVIKGRDFEYSVIMYLMISLDLSNNNFSGKIPEELVNLRELKSLNLSGNHLHGRIPNNIGNMTALESLDLSRNLLSGKIPPSMSNLNFLSSLNLSYNNLSDEIPKSTQLQSLNASSFIGNIFLCGDPLPNRCRGYTTLAPMSQEEVEEKEEDHNEDWWFRLGIGMGFGVGLLGIIVPLVFLDFWRRAYYWFFQEYVWYKIVDSFIKIKYVMGISKPLHLA